MLAAMTSKEVGEWMAFYGLEGEVTEEDEEAAQIADLGLSEQASMKLAEKLKKRRAR